jgi:predicted component of type VI protein secretion system
LPQFVRSIAVAVGGFIMRAQLVPLDGGLAIDVVKDLTVVGRKEDCDLRLEHKSVSKMHCVIVKTDGLLLLRDLGSTNGTRVNGQRIRRAALLPDDQLSVASLRFKVYLGPDVPEPPAPVASEHTQQLDAREVAGLLRQAPVRPADKPAEPVHPNPLPDLYPEDASKH